MIKRGCAVSLDGWLYDLLKVGERAELKDVGGDYRAIIAFGGDGTLLRCLPIAAAQKVPVLGVNMGHAGFLLELDPGMLEVGADRLLSGAYDLEERMMLKCELDGSFSLAMNDVAVSRGQNPSSISVSAYADKELIYTSHGDGILVTSATGTTGYGLSAGGPVVHPELECLSVVPICSHDLHLRPVVLPADKKVRLLIRGLRNRKHQIAIDGQTVLCLEGQTEIRVSKAEERVCFIRFSHQGFITKLHQKQRDWTQQTNGGL
ncbi:MAG: NAD(+)/NADH kinase [Eubacteriales bacterium]|nr:NAD(+)/NADH kinase [Eubacteriales bacterium]